MPMDDNDDASALAWLWVIEALSTFKEITTSTLQGLIDAAPVRTDDFSEKTRELVAKRCLEELCADVDGVGPDVSSNLDSRIKIDFSRSCEDVLQEILGEIPLSNLKMARVELLKWDVHTFIKHKRAGTIKCHLEQLKESILEGTHPHTHYLKERSGLFHRNSSYTVHVNDGKCDDHSEKDDENSTDAEKMGEKEKSASVSLILENENKSSKEHFLDNKRNKVYSNDDHLMGCLHQKRVYINECDDFLRNCKRIKCYASANFESEKEKPDSQLRKEVSEASTERILISEKVGHHTKEFNRVTLGNGSLEGGHNGCTASNLCHSSSHNEVFCNESNIPFNATLMAQHTFGGENSQQQQVESIPTNVSLLDGIQHGISGSKPCSKLETDPSLKDPKGSQQTVARVKAPDDTGNSCRVEITGDRIVYQDEDINHSIKMHKEQNLGMNCNEGGQLLVCDGTTDPSVPDSCLDMTTTFMLPSTSGIEPCENTSMHETIGIIYRADPISINDYNTDKVQHMIKESQPNQKEPNVASLSFSHKPVANDQAVVDTVNGCGAELSSDSDGYHNVKNDLAAKKHKFLSSRLTFDQDFTAMTESTGPNLCMKCNKGGQLLACKTTTCPLMVHKNCLGVSTQLDAKGNYFCPFCVYSHTVSEYLEAKKKASMARKELAIFISKGIGMQAAEFVHEFHKQDHSLSKDSRKCEHIHVKNNGDDQFTGCEDNREVHVGEHANEANNLQSERSQLQAPISYVHSSCREKENVNNGLIEVLGEEEEIGEMPNAQSLNGERIEEMEMPPDPVDGHNDKFTCEKTHILSANQRNGEEVPVEPRKHDMKGTFEPVCAHDSGTQEVSEDECEKHIFSRYSMRMRKHETHYKSQASPQLRRKKTSWTAEEEELIREGVRKFGNNDSKIPWKKILAFGAHVFEKNYKHRTPQDLKDKWKNMCKTQSKSKRKVSS